MKPIKLIFICVCLSATALLSAQDLDPNEIYYNLELIPVAFEDDTSDTYQVILVIESSDLDLFSSISVESDKKSETLTVSKEERKDNSSIKQKDKNYHLDMKGWKKDEKLEVTAIKLDGSKMKLKKHPRGSEFTHVVVTTKAKTRNVKRFVGPGIVEDEIEE